jgi:hypothetical protein
VAIKNFDSDGGYKMRIALKILAAILLVGYLYYARQQGDKCPSWYYLNEDIQGEVIGRFNSRDHGIVKLRVKTENGFASFYNYPDLVDLWDKDSAYTLPDFWDAAETGDSIIKRKNDTLTVLIKKGGVKRYYRQICD